MRDSRLPTTQQLKILEELSDVNPNSTRATLTTSVIVRGAVLVLCATTAALAILMTPCKSFAARQDEIRIAPPPPRVFSDEEKARLTAVASDRRKRMRLSIELATLRLTRAEQLTAQQLYANASTELGGYEALVEDAFAFMQREAAGGDKQRDLFKRFEQTLRAHTLRIEAIRRTTPPDYAVHVATTIKFARAVRTKALDAFFGEGSVRDDDADGVSRNRNMRRREPFRA